MKTSKVYGNDLAMLGSMVMCTVYILINSPLVD